VLDADLMEKYLTALGCKVTRSSTNPFKFSVTPPSWRADLEREIDLIEEIIRLHGYNEVIAATTSNLPLEPDVAREHEWRLVDRMKSACVELGFREAITWSLIPPQDTRNFRNSLEPAEVINPLSEDLSRLRTSLAQSLLRAVERNINNGSSDVRLFEWGKCFWMKDEEICEGRRLGVVLTGNNLPESWNEKPSALTLAHLRGIAIQIARRLRLDNLNFNYYDIPGYLTEGIRMTLGTASPVEVAVFGRIGQDIASSFGVDLPVWYIEFNGDRLLESAGSTPRYRPLPRYPVARRDLAFLIAETISAGEMENILISSGGELLQSVTLFDIYSGKGIPTGKKSLAYHLTFRRNDRTLSDKEVDDAVGRIIEQARQKVSAELRSS
jgi:phenylalanyl-tRNA synthetase beta chain